MNFRQRNWFLNSQQWFGLVAGAFGIVLIAAGWISAWWLLVWFVMHNLIVIGASACYHRLITHKTYETSRVWEIVMTFFAMLSGIGSILQWGALHIEHHRTADTTNDPHLRVRPLRYLFWKQYNAISFKIRRSSLVTRDKLHLFIHEYYILLIATICLVAALISPLFLLFGILAPMGTVVFGGGLHTAFSHWGGKPRQLSFLEFLYPLGGEWLHGDHHGDVAKWDHRSKWWHLDTSALLIKLIKK